MGIKNWTVIAEGTKSASAREIYFEDEKHPQHKNTTNIINIFGDEKQTSNIIKVNEERKIGLAKQRKGGRPPKEATEFVLSLPNIAENEGFRATRSQWNEMLKGALTDMIGAVNAPKPIYEKNEEGKKVKVGETEPLSINGNDLKHIMRAVVHEQAFDDSGNAGGDHMHLMIGNSTLDGVKMELNRKAVLHTLKMSWNKQVRNTLGICNTTYVAKKKYQNAAKKRAPRWKVRASRAIDKANELKEESRINRLHHRFKDVPKIQELVNGAERSMESIVESMESGNYLNARLELDELKETVEQKDEIISGITCDKSQKAVNGLFDNSIKRAVSAVEKELAKHEIQNTESNSLKRQF